MNLPTKPQTPQSLLPAFDPLKPAETLSWPDWLTQRVTSASSWGEGIMIEGKRRPTIPTSLTLTGPMRTAIETRLATLEQAAEPGPMTETFAALGDMIRFFASSRMDKDVVSGKAKVYFEVTKDLPAWAVKEAILRWYKGATGDAPDQYSFAPSPGRLRQITEFVLNVAKGQVHPLQRLLDAVPYDGLDERQRAAAQERFAGILAGVTPPVEMVRNEGRAQNASERQAILEADRAERAQRRAREGEAA